MSHFAKVFDGKVIQVIVADESFFENFLDHSPGSWVQTSYNTRGGIHYGEDGKPDGKVALRGNFAGIGFIYDQVNDVFYPPMPVDKNGIPCKSWKIESPNWTWTPPIPVPFAENLTFPERYVWDETTVSWVLINSVVS